MSANMVGQLLALLSAVSFACANVTIARTSQSGGDKGVMFSVFVTMALSFFLWIVLEAHGPGETSGDAWWRGLAWFIAAGFFAMVLGRNLLYESIRKLGVTRSTAVKRLIPFFSVLLASAMLGEPVTGVDSIGMFAIALGFGFLIHDSFRQRGGKLRVEAPAPHFYLVGVLSALAYAFAYVTRKIGMESLPSPAFGTFVSALAGFLFFIVMAGFSHKYRTYFRGMFSFLDRWIVMSAVFVSLGQILLFAALAFEIVSTVAMIASLEIFFSMFLSIVVLKNEPAPNPRILLAALLAMVGVALVALD